MNIIFCTSSFQVLIAKEIARTTGEKFIGVYQRMSYDDRQRIYAEKMSEFCEDTLFIEDESWGRELRKKLENVKLEKLYLSSLDNPIALGILSFAPIQLFTFDDGSTSLITPNMYTVNPSRVVSHNCMMLENVIEISQGHYTVFNRNTIFLVSKLIKMNFNVEPDRFTRANNGRTIKANNGRTIKVFLGQLLGSSIDDKDVRLTEKFINKAITSLGDVLYYPHPRVPLKIENATTVATNFCFEEEIYRLLTEYEFVEVYGFYSTSFVLIKDIPGVSVKSFRTFLTTNEAQIYSNLGIECINLPLWDIAVDIIMPVYNSEETVEDAIKSVLNQTHTNYKLVIVDNDSTDRTEDICKKYLEDIRVVYHKVQHGGISEALNTGISLATADYIARQDSDSEWMPWHLDFLLNELDSNPNLDIIGSKVIEDENKMPGGIRRNYFNTLSGEQLWLTLAYRNVFNHYTVIFKKKAYEEAGRYDSEFAGFEDWHLWACMVTKNNAVVLNTVTVHYRLSESYKKRMLFRSRLARSRGLRLEDVMR